MRHSRCSPHLPFLETVPHLHHPDIYALFAIELIGPGRKKSLKVRLWVEVAFALFSIPLVLFTAGTTRTDLVNGYLVIAGTPRESESNSSQI